MLAHARASAPCGTAGRTHSACAMRPRLTRASAGPAIERNPGQALARYRSGLARAGHPDGGSDRRRPPLTRDLPAGSTLTVARRCSPRASSRSAGVSRDGWGRWHEDAHRARLLRARAGGAGASRGCNGSEPSALTPATTRRGRETVPTSPLVGSLADGHGKRPWSGSDRFGAAEVS